MAACAVGDWAMSADPMKHIAGSIALVTAATGELTTGSPHNSQQQATTAAATHDMGDGKTKGRMGNTPRAAIV
jgi:hypothetical protein